MRRRGYGPRLVDWTGERCVPWAPDIQSIYEHLHRYRFARELVRGREVLDLGSGEGFGAATLAEAATRVHGVDLDRRTVDHARLNYGCDRVSFAVGDATTLAGVPDAAFDAVVAFEVLEQVDAHDALLATITRVLRPGGLVAISTPNRRRYSDPRREENPFHVHELDEAEFSALLHAHFPVIRLFSQIPQAGSHLEALRPGDSAHQQFLAARRTDTWVDVGLPEPLYMLAVGGDASLPAMAASSTLLDPEITLIAETEARAVAAAAASTEQLRVEREVHRLDLARARDSPAGLAVGTWPARDAEFVDRCCTRVLGRCPDADERGYLLERLAVVGRAELLAELLDGDEHRELIKPPPFVPAGHFYSPIPSAEDVEAHRAFDWHVPELPGIDLRADAQLELLERFAQGYAELPFAPEPCPGLRYHYDNPNYSYSDAIFLVSMIRQLKPRRFIEVGSGDSSCALLDANDRFFGGAIELTFIEPYADYLRSLVSPAEARRLRLLESRLQDVPLEEFTRLQANDVLFVDSTHVSKLGSDVNRVLFDILPRLSPGVHVHLHDVFWPFEYPHEWLAEGRSWNEQYALRAFLEFNDSFEIVLFGHWVVTRHQDWFAERMPLCLRNPGGAI